MAGPRKVTPDVDMEKRKTFVFRDETFDLRTRFKIGKFFRLLEQNPVTALELIMQPESFEKFEELEMDMDEFKEFMEAMSECLSGGSAKN